MPFKKKNPNPKGEMTGLLAQEVYLKKLIRNPALAPAKRLKADIRLMWLFATGNKKKVLQIVLYGKDSSLTFDADEGTIKKPKYHKTAIKRILKDVTLSPDKANLAYYLLSWLCSSGDVEKLTRCDLIACKLTSLKNSYSDGWEDEEKPSEDVLEFIRAIEGVETSGVQS